MLTSIIGHLSMIGMKYHNRQLQSYRHRVNSKKYKYHARKMYFYADILDKSLMDSN